MKESMIRRLIKLVEESNVEELEISRWGRKVRISKKARASSANDSESAAATVVSLEQPSSAPAAETPASSETEAENLVAIKSPMVGTCYRAATPGAEPFAKTGQVIEKGAVVCIVEAMKLMNEIESEISGRIVKVLVEDGQPVEFGQSLFLVEPS
jgi:acetyl-CoA carboxylase biotin carboxyl carrier protein